MGNHANNPMTGREKKSLVLDRWRRRVNAPSSAQDSIPYSAMFTLDVAQQLYEHKLLSYPRTDSRYITEDMRDSVAELVKTACAALNLPSDFVPNTARIADSAKVSDHYALLPTSKVSRAVLSDLYEEQRNVLELVLRRLLEATAKPYVYEETVVLLESGGKTFTAKGKTVVEPGWKVYGEKEIATGLPPLRESDTIPVTAKRRDRKTSPPSAYTDGALLEAMENAASGDFTEGVERSGLGTPATRAATIEKLVDCGYVKRMGRNLVPTQQAKLLIEMLPEELTSPMLTAQWENELLQVERGEVSAETFMEDIAELTRRICSVQPDLEAVRKLTYYDVDEVGKCPRCGKPVYEHSNGYFCSGENCTFALWKNSSYLAKAGIKLTRSLATELIAEGHAPVENVTFADSHTGELILVEQGGKYPSYKYKATDQERY